MNEVIDINAQGSQLRKICIIVFFLCYGGWNGQNCCQIKLGNKTMSCNSTHFLLLHGSLIKLFILSMSSVWKKEVDIVSTHHECDCNAPYMRLYILWKATINKQGSCSKKYRNFTYRQTYLYHQNYPLH